MKYCIDYTPSSIKINEVDEINVPFNKDKILVLMDFLKEHINQRTNIYIKDIKECIDYKIVEKLVKIYKENLNFNFAIKFEYYDTNLDLDLLRKNNIKFYINEYISEWEDFLDMISLGVSDIYVTQDLAFELNNIKKVVPDSVQIRAFPNISQKIWKEMPPLKSFFIRPEDVLQYESYIDILEFYGDRTKHDILYEIYAKDKEWFGNLNELILELNLDLDNKFIIPRFAEKRIRCNRECLKGGKCKMCDKIIELANTLEKANLIVKIDKEDK